MLHKILCTWLRTSTRRRKAGGVPRHDVRQWEKGVGGDGHHTPPRNNLTQRIYSLQPPSPQPHDGCGLDITWPLLCDAFKPPSKREINQWLASSESTSILTLSPQTSSKSPSILTLSPDSSPLVSGSAAAPTSSSIDEACEYLNMEITNSCLRWPTGSSNNWATPVRIEVSILRTESPVWRATISNKYFYVFVCMGWSEIIVSPSHGYWASKYANYT